MASSDIHDDRDESPAERADRNWDELLQELRVMQTGSQILAGFLLAVAFQPRFTELTPEQVVLYLVLVALAGLSTLLALAPVTVHRRYFGQHRKPNVVAIAARFVIADLVVIGALSVGVTTLVFEVTLGRDSRPSASRGTARSHRGARPTRGRPSTGRGCTMRWRRDLQAAE